MLESNEEFLENWPRIGDRLFVQNSWAIDAAIATSRGERLYRLKIAFKNAADLLVNHTTTHPHERPNLVWPIVFCYRQYIELALKDVIDSYGLQVMTGPEIRPNWNSHKLEDLWISYKRIIGQTLVESIADDIQGLPAVEACINEFVGIDPGSYTFRYPVGRDGRQTEIPCDSIDLYHLRDVMERLCIFFDATESSLDEHFNPTQQQYP